MAAQNASQDLRSISPRGNDNTESDTETRDQSHVIQSDAFQSELHHTQLDFHQDNTRDADLLEEKSRQLKRARKFEEALKYIDLALQMKPTDTSKLFLKAMILEDSGKLNESILILKSLIEMDKENSVFPYHYGRALYFLHRYEESFSYFSQVILSYGGKYTKIHQFAVRMFVMIMAFISPTLHVSELLRFVDQFKKWTPEVTKMVNKDERTHNDYVFARTITSLIQQGMQIPRALDDTRDRIYVIGESHSLPLCWQNINLFGKTHVMYPRLVMGLKAWLFSEEIPKSKESASLKICLDSLPPKSKVLVVCGEIDCRHDIGVDKAVKHGHYESEREAIRATVCKYIGALSLLVSQTFIVHSIRPPLHPKFTSRIESFDILEKERQRILMFNEELRMIKKPENIYLLDVYEELIDDDGWLKSEFKSDDIHLNHTYIPLLQQKLNNL